MGLVRVQWQWTRDSGLPEDAIVNTFYFDASADNSTVYDNIVGLVAEFYTVGHTGTGSAAVSTWLSSDLTGAWQAKVYDLSDAEPRIPVFEEDGTATVGSGQGLPAEVALCLSFQGAQTSGVNQARRRGRVYIGPLDASALTTDPVGKPVQGLIDSLTESGARLITQSATISSEWVVYSPTNHVALGLANAGTVVTDGWVDNAFDTQRRRGEAPTTRQTFT